MVTLLFFKLLNHVQNITHGSAYCRKKRSTNTKVFNKLIEDALQNKHFGDMLRDFKTKYL